MSNVAELAGDGPQGQVLERWTQKIPQGTRIWVEHPKEVWESATVTSDYGAGVLTVKLGMTGEIRLIKIKDESHMPPLRNSPLLTGLNDLASLTYLHEPALLYNLKVRFCDRMAIYTYCGRVLIALNPYHDLRIYGDETIMAYRGQAKGDLDPHIYAVSEEAYTSLEREKRNQSIIVSGESGAGKTVSAKHAMHYFAAVGGIATEASIDMKVIASSTIIEAMGNAKTNRNDNSSRFGKFIEILFDDRSMICGARVRSYLLEKSRVVYQSRGERNYHIFYQLCAAAHHLPELNLDHQDSFYYLSQGDSPNIDGVDDLIAFNETRNVLTTFGITESEQQIIFVILAAILHLGNIEFTHNDRGAYVDKDGIHLETFSSLLGISKNKFAYWLTHQRIKSMPNEICPRMNKDRANITRDALAKRMYGQLFDWLVEVVNRVLDTNQLQHFIGILDLYGFERFETNSFEQFCINYADEKLQQQFNCHVFKLEQEEYEKENVSWNMIEFYDNQPCIKLIEDRLGVLGLLDEVCWNSEGSDSGFVNKLHVNCAKYQHYKKPKFSESAFRIKHFADDVEYQCRGFVEKNRDTVSAEQLKCINSSKCCTLIREIFGMDRLVEQTSMVPHSGSRTTSLQSVGSLTKWSRPASGLKQTVGAEFRASLTALMSTVSTTTPHYVRCINPNDDKRTFKFDQVRVVKQLRACGVLETSRISAAGYPSRLLYQDFLDRYRLLCPNEEFDRAKIIETCQKVLARHLKDEYKLGNTKVFIRAGQIAYMEKIRQNIQLKYCVMVQSCVRRFVARRKYLRLKAATMGMQALARACLARRNVQEIRQAAIKLQSNIRGWLARVKCHQLRIIKIAFTEKMCINMQHKYVVVQSCVRRFVARRKYLRLKAATIGMQALARAYLARRNVQEIRRKRNQAAIKLQSNIRGWLARVRYHRLRRRKVLAVITLQKYFRGYLARQKVRRMRRQIIVAQSAIRRYLARCHYKRLQHDNNYYRIKITKLYNLVLQMHAIAVENNIQVEIKPGPSEESLKNENLVEESRKELTNALASEEDRRRKIEKKVGIVKYVKLAKELKKKLKNKYVILKDTCTMFMGRHPSSVNMVHVTAPKYRELLPQPYHESEDRILDMNIIQAEKFLTIQCWNMECYLSDMQEQSGSTQNPPDGRPPSRPA